MMLTLSIVSCRTVHDVQIVERIERDTIFQGHLQYDSIYIDNTLFVDRTADTVFIHNTKTQYKFKFLRDTTYIHRVDTVPVIQRVEVVQKERYIPPWCKYLAIFGALCILFIIILVYPKLSLS